MRRTILRLRLPPHPPGFTRTFSTTTTHLTSWSPGPSPPRLPKSDQEIFEQLQRQSTGAFSTPSTTPRISPTINQSPHSSPTPATEATTASAVPDMIALSQGAENLQAKVRDGEELHPNVRRGAPPEFEGEVNPKTGESGGPKNEPLRWGGEVDWSYNGRVTDF